MHCYLLVVVMALTGQVTGGDRYGNITGNPGAESGAWENNLQGAPAEGSAASGLLPQQPASQPGVGLPGGQSDYRSQGQSQLGGSDPAGANTIQPKDLAGNLPASDGAGANDSAEGVKPSELIRSLLIPPATGQLPGTPITLAEAVEGASSRGDQTRRIEVYWELTSAVAEYHLALREVTILQTLQQSVLQPSSSWAAARQALNQRGRVARRAAQTAQIRLQQMLGRASDFLPLPSDLPHCGAYDTRYEEIFGGRLPSTEAQQLHELLPLEQQNLRQLTVEVAEAEQWLHFVSERRDPQTDGSGLLKAYELLSLRQRAFVQALRSYNSNITRYAEIAIPGMIGTERLVAMLIYTDSRQATARNDNAVRQANSVESLGGAAGGDERTFAGEQQDQPDGTERSILTLPRGR
ncbi:MAG: hypothetical protein KDA57_11940 [Planctomycetales bacterium]|nr:hypothetical protein [Planctomycetales bacterium]